MVGYREMAAPRNWIIATILRIEDGCVAEQREEVEDEAP